MSLPGVQGRRSGDIPSRFFSGMLFYIIVPWKKKEEKMSLPGVQGRRSGDIPSRPVGCSRPKPRYNVRSRVLSLRFGHYIDENVA